MNSQQSQVSKFNMPAALRKQLSRFRARLRILKLLEAGLAALVGFLLAYLLLFSVERFFACPAPLRLVWLVLATAGFSIGLPWALRKWVWRTRRWEQVALCVKDKFPVLGDEILGIVEMTQDQVDHGASQSLIEAATQQTSARVQERDLSRAVPAKHAKRRAVLALGTVGLTGILILVVPSAAKNAWQRFLNPWSNTPRFTFARINDLPDELVVPYGEAFSLAVQLHQDSDWKPDSATGKIGATLVSASRNAETYPFSLPAQTSATEFALSIGDDSRSVQIRPVTRPELSEIVAQIDLPDYLQRDQTLHQTVSGGRVAVLRGSQLEFAATINRSLKTADWDDQSLEVNGSAILTGPMAVNQNRNHILNWRDTFDLQPRNPVQLEVIAVEDQLPTIVFEKLKETILLRNRSLRFNFHARDDYGIKKIGIQWLEYTPNASGLAKVLGEKLLVAGGPEDQSISEQGVLSPQLENVPAAIIQLRLFVEDYLPGRERAYSRVQTLQVMTQEQHVAWIDQQMQRWKSKADAIYEREVALAEENDAIRRLSPKEKRDPENIRRIQNQIAAQRENAQRLDQAVDRGQKLIEQALMNENLRADQVARWTESLQQLRQIAREGMPEIVDQLNEINEQLKQPLEPEDVSSPQGAQSEDSSQDHEKPSGSPTAPSEDANPTPPSENGESEEPNTAGENRMPQMKADDSEETEDESDETNDSNSQPRLQDAEQSMLEQKESSKSDGKSENGDSKEGGSLGLPETSLMNPPDSEKGPVDEPAEDSSEDSNANDNSQQGPSMDKVVEDHEDLLEAFREAREAMNEIMAEFENSTFVKRLKSASRSQLSVASRLNNLISRRFGTPSQDPSDMDANREKLLSLQKKLVEDMGKIKTDLKAYQTREPDDSRQAILEEMESLNMMVKLEELPLRVKRNRVGDALHRSEYWADTMDRWAEELVPPSRPGGGGGGGGGDQKSMPPSIVLEVLRQIEDEMNLRDETRGFERARSAMTEQEQQQRNDGLTVYQMAVQQRSLDTIDDIKQLPNGEADFPEPIDKLKKAVAAMNEASGMLFDGTTGSPAVAAESAAIEALLASRRVDPGKSDSNQQENNSGSDGSESLAGPSPMSKLNPDGIGQSRLKPRDSGASSTSTQDNVPERFRNGIDSFTNELGRWRRRSQP